MKKMYDLLQKSATVIMAVALTGLILGSCTKDVSTPGGASNVLKLDCGESTYVLWAGQSINAGNLNVWNDFDNLYIEYEIIDPSQALQELHLWAGTSLEGCPQTKKDNPVPGQFPYYASPTASSPYGYPYLVNPMYYLLVIPLADLGVDLSTDCGGPLYIAAHGKATVETMWSEGTRFVPPPGTWATYSTYTICCNDAKK
jgi:hypothetical protein